MSAKKVFVLVVLAMGAIWATETFKTRSVSDDAFTKAEVLYHALQYDKALAAYQESIVGDLGAVKTELAYFRIAMCLQELRKYPQAMAAYETAIQKYPQSAEASRAQGAMERLKLESGQ